MKIAGPSSIRSAPNGDGSDRPRRHAPNRRIFAYAHPFRSDLVRLVMTATAYLAGPDVFLPNAAAHAARKVEICRQYGLRGLPPLNEDIETAAKTLNETSLNETSLNEAPDVWRSIYDKDIAMMERSD